MKSEYLTHDNGGRPLRVEINKKENTISAFINYNFDEFTKLFNKKVFSSKYQKIWIGKSPKTEMTTFSGGHGPKFDGNSILIEKSNNTYVFIGDTIFSFKSIKPITEFVSPVGNSDVPYPYAIDSEGNVYLMLANIIITPNPSTIKVMSNKVYKEDPYLFYYIISDYLRGFELKKSHIKAFDSILTASNISTNAVNKKKLTVPEMNKIFGLSTITSKKQLVARLL